MANTTGKKHGGRVKGTPNKRTQNNKMACVRAGMTPLEYLINIMVDETEEKDARRDAAKAAAPYIHPKLSSSHVTTDDPKTIDEWLDDLSNEEGQSDSTEE